MQVAGHEKTWNLDRLTADGAIAHWYDFTCPFCYLAQNDNNELVRQGWRLVELGFSAHPEIPEDGIFIGPRKGQMYAAIEQEAARLNMPLNWPDRLPSSRFALGVTEWIRTEAPDCADSFRRAMFSAHFAENRDIGNREVVITSAERSGVAIEALVKAVDDGATDTLLDRARVLGRQHGVSGTPAWFGRGQLFVGRQPGGMAQRIGLP